MNATLNRWELTPLEVAAGRTLGPDPFAPPLPSADPAESMVGALEKALLRAMQRSPCLLTFSGGRDSSGLLALAVEVARREGLEPPVPITYRFPGVPEVEESAWQEGLVRWLGLSEWERLTIGDELDIVGPYATDSLRRHGLLWPFNSFFHSVAFERASHGSVITGAFGDEVLSPDPRLARRRLVLTGKIRPQPSDILRLAWSASPSRIRAAVDARRGYPAEDLPGWLTAGARAAVIRYLAVERSRKPLSARKEVEWWWGNRYPQIAMYGLRQLASDYDCEVVAPYFDPGFLATFAVESKWVGFSRRTQLMEALFAERLPAPVIERTTKALYMGVFWRRHTTQFVADWSGEGLNPDLVDVDYLMHHWKNQPGNPLIRDYRSALLLQSVWLARHKA